MGSIVDDMLDAENYWSWEYENSSNGEASFNEEFGIGGCSSGRSSSSSSRTSRSFRGDLNSAPVHVGYVTKHSDGYVPPEPIEPSEPAPKSINGSSTWTTSEKLQGILFFAVPVVVVAVLLVFQFAKTFAH